MEQLIDFYKRTWWAWTLLIVALLLLGWYINPIVWIVIPGLLVYSVYFGLVRSSDTQP
jgi:hypothetical protein